MLDVACGTGIVARRAAGRTGAAGAVVGLDLNADMLRVARTVSADVRPAIEWREGSAAELPFPDGAFDAVFCEQAMQFFSNPVQALGEMRRVLAPRGRAAVSVCRPIRYSPAYVTRRTRSCDTSAARPGDGAAVFSVGRRRVSRSSPGPDSCAWAD